MVCYCFLRNVQDLLADGKTPYERRFGEPIEGPVIPFGAMVEYHPISARDQVRLHQLAIFFGYAKIAGGILGRRYSGRRHWEIGKHGRIGNPSSKNQCKRILTPQR